MQGPDRRRPLAAPSARGAGTLRRVRRSEGLLTLGILAYLATFIVLPGVHLSNHRADHRHDGDEMAAHEHEHSHLHAPLKAVVVRDLLSQPPPQEAPGPAPDGGHGHGSAAHLSAALISVATYVFVPIEAPSEPTDGIPLRSLCDRGFGSGVHARGPPSAG
jgi:hypothetical protein